MSYKKFSPEIKKIISTSRNIAIRYGANSVETGHIFLAILEQLNPDFLNILTILNVNYLDLVEEIQTSFFKELINSKEVSSLNLAKMGLSKEAETILKQTLVENRWMGDNHIKIIHLTLAILHMKKIGLIDLFKKEENLTYKKCKNIYLQTTYRPKVHRLEKVVKSSPIFTKSLNFLTHHLPLIKNYFNPTWTISRKEVLDVLKVDLSKWVENNEPLVFTRNSELLKVTNSLLQKPTKVSLIITPSKIYKKAFIETLAIQIKKELFPELIGYKIIQLKITKELMYSNYGHILALITYIDKSIKNDEQVIFFIDNFENVFLSLKKNNKNILSEYLYQHILSSPLKIIGSTSDEAFLEKAIKPTNFAPKFETINLGSPSQEETFVVIQSLQQRQIQSIYITYPETSLKLCIALSEKYLSGKPLYVNTLIMLREIKFSVIKNKIIPEHLREDELSKIEALKELKNQAIKSKQYVEAISLDKQEKETRKSFNAKFAEWYKKEEREKIPVQSEDIYQVFHKKTGLSIEDLQNGKDV